MDYNQIYFLSDILPTGKCVITSLFQLLIEVYVNQTSHHIEMTVQSTLLRWKSSREP